MRAARTASILLALLLLALPLGAFSPAGASTDDDTRSGGLLEVTNVYLVNSREEWDAVVVREDAMLHVQAGGVLVTGSMDMEGGSSLHIAGGTLHILDMDGGGISNDWDVHELTLTDGGLLNIEGRPGNGTSTLGSSSVLTVIAAQRITMTDSQILVIGGDGHSPDTPVTEGDVSGNQFSGGDAAMRLLVTEKGASISMTRSSVRVMGGEGGKAPDARAPVDGVGGQAGGYTAGGNVSYAGNGGSSTFLASGDNVRVTSSVIEIFAGDGGDAGDGGPGGVTAGGGGGGYSGGTGAGSQGTASGGGDVVGTGIGGEAAMSVEADEYGQTDSRVLVAGGGGGDAGDGGDCDVSRSSTALGGGGGGGYSGGGGGTTGETNGTDGGPGGSIGPMVGSGGGAVFSVEASLATISGGQVEVAGGTGGRGGSAGTSTRSDADWLAGGGGGSYSAGGGAGTSSATWASGAGGVGRIPERSAGAGGDASLLIDAEEAIIPANVSLNATTGEGGDCLRSDAPGSAGGQGLGLVTRDGYVRETVPKAKVALITPDHGQVSSKVPTFRWAPAHPSSSAGDVLVYQFQMDDDPGFYSPDLKLEVSTDQVTPAWVPNFTSYWKVRALYERPDKSAGPWSDVRSFTYINMPPSIVETPVFDVMVSQVTVIDLSPYVTDVDDARNRLSVDCDHERVLSTTRLNITVHFPEEMGLVVLNITVTDTLNHVPAQLMLNVTRYRHHPHISGLTNHKPPLELKVFEGTEAWYDIFVHDVDSEEFSYWTAGSWEGARTFPNGTLRVRGERGDVGDHTFTLWVADEGGREDSMRVYVEVLNVNDPPDPPSIVSPNKRVTIRVGELVSFSAVVSDPDLRYGQVLNVSFISNETGVFKTLRTTTLATTDYNLFSVGQHVVTVVVSDGQYSASDQVVVNVEEPPSPPPVTSPGSEGPSMWVYVVASLLLFAVGFSVGHLQTRRGREVDGSP